MYLHRCSKNCAPGSAGQRKVGLVEEPFDPPPGHGVATSASRPASLAKSRCWGGGGGAWASTLFDGDTLIHFSLESAGERGSTTDLPISPNGSGFADLTHFTAVITTVPVPASLVLLAGCGGTVGVAAQSARSAPLLIDTRL